jgi:hypothetical protein
LANVRVSEGAQQTEWVFFDPQRGERFTHEGNTLIPGSGKRWSHGHRTSRVPPQPSGGSSSWFGGGSSSAGAGGDKNGGGAASSSTVVSSAIGDDDDELPWQVIGIRDNARLDELRRRDQNHRRSTEEAYQRRERIGAPPASAPSQATAPPEGEVDDEAVAEAVAASESVIASGDEKAYRRMIDVSPPHDAVSRSPWTRAAWLVRCATAARHVRHFGGAAALADEALRHFPLYTAALHERALVHLDSDTPKDALSMLERLHRIDVTWPRLGFWLVHTHAAMKRKEKAQAMATVHADPPVRFPPGCEEVKIGSHELESPLTDRPNLMDGPPPHGVPATPTADGVKSHCCLSSPDVRCAATANKRNWLGGDVYDDTFAIEQSGTTLRVTRTDGGGVGWGLDLRIRCCSAAGEAALNAPPPEPAVEPEVLARLKSDNHYLALGVAVDFTSTELKKTFRRLSISLHPDRQGGSTELFARAAAAHDCLADEACKKAFDEGHEVEGFRPTLKEAVERHYYAENFPFEPFGDPWQDHGEQQNERRERARVRQRQRAGFDDPQNNASMLAAEAKDEL